jgi:hypothetical protein
MFMLNRSILIIRPKQPYLDWVNRVEDTDRKWEMADVSSAPSVYLLPEIDEEIGVFDPKFAFFYQLLGF